MAKPLMSPLDVYGMIRELIVAGEYLSGDPMPEEELADRLEISRTPVREALKRLQAEGLVERRANRRVYLCELNPSTIVEIFVVRARLEPLAARLAANCVNLAFLNLLQDCIDRMDEAMSGEQPQLRAYRQANEDFHWAILRRSENGALDTTVRGVARRSITSPTFQGWTRGELNRSQSHHRELFDAFVIGDPDWAEAAMTSHLYAARATYHRIAKADVDKTLQSKHFLQQSTEHDSATPVDDADKTPDGE